MRIEDIRNTFSKGSIVLQSENCSVIYYDKGWVTQSIEGSGIEVFTKLISNCKKVSLLIKKGNSIRLSFINNNTNDEKVNFYSPIEREYSELTIEDLIKIINPSKRFIEFMDGTNMNNEDAIFNKMIEWTETKTEEMKSNVRYFDSQKKWPVFKQKALQLSNKYACQTEVIEADGITEGYINIEFPEVFTRPLIFSNENKKLLRDVIDLSTAIDFEMNPVEGYINLVLYI